MKELVISSISKQLDIIFTAYELIKIISRNIQYIFPSICITYYPSRVRSGTFLSKQ